MDYYLAYDTPVGKRPDGSYVTRVGRQKIDFCDDLDFAVGICNTMLDIYGKKNLAGNDTHWIESEAGEKIWAFSARQLVSRMRQLT